MDRFQELTAFVAVAEAGGFSAAARRCGAAQPGLSKSVAALERRLGVALLNRSTRSVTLTDVGQRYYDRTKILVEDLNLADGELTDSAFLVSGSVRISAASTFGRLHVLPLIPKLLSVYPDLKLDLVLSDSLRDMVEDRIDLAIRVGRVEEPDAVVKRVAGPPLVCVGARRYFKRHGKPKAPADLHAHNCLIYGGMRNACDWPFKGPDGKFTVRVAGNLSSNSIETIRAGVLAGVGIGLFTRASLADGLAGADIVTVLNDFVDGVRDVNLVWPMRRLVPVRVRRTTEFFAEEMPRRLGRDPGCRGARFPR